VWRPRLAAHERPAPRGRIVLERHGPGSWGLEASRRSTTVVVACPCLDPIPQFRVWPGTELGESERGDECN
jgi:hypothetical protein